MIKRKVYGTARVDVCECGEPKMLSSNYCQKCNERKVVERSESKYICECGKPKWRDADKCHVCKKEKETNYHRYYWSSHDLCDCGNPKSKESPKCRECFWSDKKKERESRARNCFVCKVELTDENWYRSNKKAGHFICKACHKLAGKNRETRHRKLGKSLKDEVMEAYGGECKCCGESNIAFLSIDHINNDGAKHRGVLPGTSFYRWLKKNDFPQDNFQCLCFNCNFAKSRNPGGCPHEIERQRLIQAESVV